MVLVEREFHVYKTAQGCWAFQVAEQDEPFGPIGKPFCAIHILAREHSNENKEEVIQHLQESTTKTVWGVLSGWNFRGGYSLHKKLDPDKMPGGRPDDGRGPHWSYKLL